MKDKVKQIEEMAKDLEKVEKEVYSKITKETYAYVKEHHRYNSKEDYSLAHTKTVFELTAEEMTKLGWIKTNKDSVVLSMEEYENLKHYENEMYRLQGVVDTLTNEGWDILDEKEEKIRKVERKETAEKIVNEVNEFFRPFDKKSPIFLDLLLTKIENIAQQFGVEIKE